MNAASPIDQREWTAFGLGLTTTDSLVVSQVVPSFGIPFALVPLVLLTRRRDIMGQFVNRRTTTATASRVASAISVPPYRGLAHGRTLQDYPDGRFAPMSLYP